VTRLLGSARAAELFLLSERVTAQDAHTMGLVADVVPDESLLAHSVAMASRVAAFSPLAIAAIKENLHDDAADLSTYLDHETVRFGRNSATHDAHEAARAFVERRQPEFEGR